ncbi:MAG: class I SAM-dependent methyltransferase [Burkholderiales bacterium]
MILRLWPLPAVLIWATAWAWYVLLRWMSVPVIWALLIATLWGVLSSAVGSNLWRRGLIVLGFPLSFALTNALILPPWVWLLPLALILLIYPLNAWRDAPLFPTPSQALRDLSKHAPLSPGARVLDAGCGLGDGLKALREAYPDADLHGLEWSWPLRAACALRCPWARVRQGDIWKADWRSYSMVYLFQRPESMPRAVAKATAELAPGAWLVSLEFEAKALTAHAVAYGHDDRPVWIYRAPFTKA